LEDLVPGARYRLRVCAENAAGKGSWSPSSLTAAVSPRCPGQPPAPTPTEPTVNTICFRWVVLDDGGAAIEKSRLQLEHMPDHPVLLKRNQTKYVCERLQPGQAYRARVQVRNCAGWSPYSEYSTFGHTLVAKPETPDAPKAVAADSTTLVLDLLAPDCFGSVLNFLRFQYRTVSAFGSSEWSAEFSREVPKEVEMILTPRSSRSATVRSSTPLTEAKFCFPLIVFLVENALIL